MSFAPSSQALWALSLFALCYVLVLISERLQLLKSIPMLLCSALLWTLRLDRAARDGQLVLIQGALDHCLNEYAHMFLFLLVAMNYVHLMQKHQLFDHLEQILRRRALSFQAMFWLTGFLAFFLSSLIDNLTTALVMGAFILNLRGTSKQFQSLNLVAIVVAANAGGVFSPYGDITSLMIWQKGLVDFSGLLKLFMPALCNFIVPAAFMAWALPRGQLAAQLATKPVAVEGQTILLSFVLTLVLTATLGIYFALPASFGMLLGMSLLAAFDYIQTEIRNQPSLEVMKTLYKTEWDTLFFFFGIILSVGALASFGFLKLLAHELYKNPFLRLQPAWAATPANVLLGFLSALIDNIPVMFAVLNMDLLLSKGQWLLITLTTGTGGSLLSIGSAAGVAMMGLAPKVYGFNQHLRWSWAILLGYIASIVCHQVLNYQLF